IKQSRRSQNNFRTHNFLVARCLPPDLVNISHVIMTGSSLNVSDGEQPWFASGKKIITRCQRQKIPFLGICFGLHFLSWAGGGRVVKKKKSAELGAVRITVAETTGTFFDFL